MVKQRVRSRTTKKADSQVPESTSICASSSLPKKTEYVLRTPIKIEMMSPRQWELKISLRNSYGGLPSRKMLDPIRPVYKLDFDDDDNVNQMSIMTPKKGSLTPKTPEGGISKGQLTFEETL
nr:hypothetical protein HmN_000957200 [Hymenolepis microstoma]